MNLNKFITHAEVEAKATEYLRRLGLRLSNWDQKKKKDGKSFPKTNRHRGHRNKQTGASSRKGK